MKNLFFVAVATGIFSGTFNTSQAQTSVHIEKLANTKKGTPLKFIDAIEITPDRISHAAVTPQDEIATTFSSLPASSNSVGIETCSPLQFKYAMLMDCDVEAINNPGLFEFIEEWWATRYRYGGTDKKGIDCSSFTGKLLQQVYGYAVPRTAKEQFDASEKISSEDLKEGDLVFFNTRGGVSHVGVYLGDTYFVHSSTHSGVTISTLTDAYYSKKFIGGGRVAAAAVTVPGEQ
jgi:murein DD-endopeptidase / murein LD-carboxypeptidase